MDLPFSWVRVAIKIFPKKQILTNKLPSPLPKITRLGKRYRPRRHWLSARFRLPVSSITSSPRVSRKCDSGAPLRVRQESKVRCRILQVSIFLRMSTTAQTAPGGYQLQACRKSDLFSPQAGRGDDGALWVM
jgi:hypothetical protein